MRHPVLTFLDLPILVRSTYANNVSAVDLESLMPGQVDIPRLRQGAVGGFFWYFISTCQPWYSYDIAIYLQVCVRILSRH